MLHFTHLKLSKRTVSSAIPPALVMHLFLPYKRTYRVSHVLPVCVYVCACLCVCARVCFNDAPSEDIITQYETLYMCTRMCV